MNLATALYIFYSLSGAYAVTVGPAADLKIVNKVISPDGYRRSAVLVDGTFPGPLIRGDKGSHFLLNVEDKLTDTSMLTDTSIHWHGLFQRGTSWADGPAFVNQCPITPGHSFLYDFRVPDQAGTFWYHSHLSTQYCDGLRGALVVYDPQDPAKHLYDVDDESTVITLADWYHYPALQAPTNVPPLANSTLINGLGRYQDGPRSELAVISVRRGKRYRFRLVSISCDPNYIFSIDGHSMTIIEVDGVNHKPLVVDSIQIFSAQRYSFILNANQTVSNYWMRANPNLGITGFDGGINSAILRYVGAPKVEPKTDASTSTLPLKEWELAPLVPVKVPGRRVPGGVDVAIRLEITFNTTTTPPQWQLNGTTFTPPKLPVLLQILSGARTAQELLPQTNLFALPPHKSIEISIPGGSRGAPHPFHLHGHTFQVIRSAGNSSYNFDNPPVRDVVSTGSDTSDLTTFRFMTDNPGPWFLHCHIDWHLDAGLAVVFAEDIPAISRENPPLDWDLLCPIYNQTHNLG